MQINNLIYDDLTALPEEFKKLLMEYESLPVKPKPLKSISGTFGTFSIKDEWYAKLQTALCETQEAEGTTIKVESDAK